MRGRSASKAVRRVLVVGCGNESRCDDGVGPYVVRALARRLGVPEAAEQSLNFAEGEVATPSGGVCVALRCEHQLDLALAEELGKVDQFVVVDAHAGTFAHAVRRQEVQPTYELSFTSHHLTPATLAGLAQTLHRRAPRTVVFSIHGDRFDFGTELSTATRAAADQAVEEILEFIMM